MKVQVVYENGQAALNVLNDAGQKIAETLMDAEALESLVAQIALVRGQVPPEVPTDFPIGRELQGIVDPRWYTELNLLTGLTSLCIRHPGLGWLAFLVPPDGTTLMRELFAKQEDARKAGVLSPSTARN